jgi:transglutaminase-like putative cysteine protease
MSLAFSERPVTTGAPNHSVMDQPVRTFNLGCDLDYMVNSPACFLLNVEVARDERRNIVSESLELNPDCPVEKFELGDTNDRIARFRVIPGSLQVRYRGTIELAQSVKPTEDLREVPVHQLPPEVIRYIFPSRYCQSDKLMRLAMHLFGNEKPGFERVTAICNWIYDNVEYISGTTDAHTSAIDTVAERAGVCRDFAHLGITFCRALNIPARFATGYAYQLNPPDFHAFFEAFLNDRWYAFDPTRLAPQTGLVRIGSGTDATRASFATIFGGAVMTSMRVFIYLEGGDTTDRPEYVTCAVAT